MNYVDSNAAIPLGNTGPCMVSRELILEKKSEGVLNKTLPIVLLAVIVLMLLSVFTPKVNAQGIIPCSTAVNRGNFGVDGDLYANYPATLTGINDDWFYNDDLYPGPGIGVIGTSALTSEPAGLSALDFLAQFILPPGSSRNYTYVQRMSVPKITPRIIDIATGEGYLLLDAVAARDNHTAGSAVDSSAFTSGSDKNGANPNTWQLGVGGVQQKNDLIDVGGHLRREFNFATLTAGDLWGFAYATTRNTSGDAHTDFEVFRTAPEIIGGALTNTGPDSGHTTSLLNLDGSLLQPGDLLVSIDYGNGGTNPLASVRVWCDPNNLDGDGLLDTAAVNLLPGRLYTFTGIFDSGTDASPYGYAEIRPNDPTQCFIWAVVNTTSQLGTPWGNLTAQNAAYSANMEPLVNVSVAINFSAFGLDIEPASGPCFNLFGSLLIKTRSSSSFTSEMKDFVGPFVFGNFGEIFAYGGNDKNIGCGITSATLCPENLPGINYPPGAIYSWSVVPGSGGNIASIDDSCIVVDAEGCYVLTVTHPSLSNCSATDTVCVFGSPDPNPPVVTCPPTSEWNCLEDLPPCPATIEEFELAGGTVTDESDISSFTCSDGPLTGGECGGTVTRTFEFTDECGNSGTCEQIFIINDDVPPIITGPADEELGCNPTIPPADTSLATATDNCPHVEKSVLDDVITGDCNKTLTRTYVATDECDNEATWVQIFTYKVDLDAPVITATGIGGDLGCNPTEQQIEDALGSASATDNCDASVDITPTTDAPINTTGCFWSVTRHFNAVDSCGNDAIQVDVTVTYKLDTEAPVITADNTGSDIGCNPSANDIEAALGGASATDNCDASVIVGVITDEPVNTGGCFWSVTRHFSASDSCGNPAIPVDITVTYKVDTEAPVISATGTSIELGCNPTLQEIEDALGDASASDNCDASVDVTATPGTPVNTGGCYWSQSITFTAEDECGNASDPVTVTVTYKIDTEVPVITADKTGSDLGCNPSANDIEDALGDASAIDNCDASVIVVPTTDAPVNTTGCYWSVTRHFNATDSCGNNAVQVDVTITYKVDTEAPVIIADKTGGDIGCNPSANEIEDALGEASATDNCDASVIVGVITDEPVNTAGCFWSVTRHFSATDSCGNPAIPVDITVTYKVDTEAPVISATGSSIDLGCNPTLQEIEDALGDASASDNCDASVDVTATPGTPVNIGGCYWSQSITFTAEDECGNASDPVTVTVTYKIDTEAPVIIADKSGSDLGCNPSANEIEDALGDASATDNCDASVIVGVITDAPVNTAGCFWSVTRHFSATDSCGNPAIPVDITVTYKVDTEAPVISATGSSIDLGCNPTQQEIEDALGDATASDNCDVSVDVTATPGTPVNTGGCNWSQSITFTAEDDCGNVSDPVTITITYKIDITAPVITPDKTNAVLGCNPTNSTVNNYLGSAIALDDCDGSFAATATTGLPVNIGGCWWTRTRYFTAVDACGNQATEVTVTVTYKIDNGKPVITPDNADAFIGCNPTPAEIEDALGGATGSDNCDESVIVNVSTSEASNTDGCNWSITRTFTAVDSCGNAADPVTVTVTYKIDEIAPVITPDKTNAVLGCNPTNSTLDNYLGDATATDNCDASVIVVATTDNPVSEGGCMWSRTRRFNAVDSCGNAAAEVTVTVTYKVDTEKPVITATGQGGDLGCNPSSNRINNKLGGATATDNCDASVIVNVSTSAPVNTYGCYWEVTRTFTAVDSCGNEADPVTKTVTYKIDIIKPVIVPDNVSAYLGCNPTLTEIEDALGSATATDNCDESVIVNSTTTDPVNYSGCLWRQRRTFTAVDSCGNSAIRKTVTVTWRVDTIAPVIIVPNQFIDLGCNPTSAQISAALGTATATDNCGNVSPHATTSTVQINGCYRTRTRTWTAVDRCGNAAVPMSRVVTWKVDRIAPVVECNKDGDIVICEGGSVDLKPEAFDNCEGEVPVTCTRSDGKTNLNDPFDPGVTTVTCTATDSCGNTGSCSITVTVIANPSCSIIAPETLPLCGSKGNTLTSNSSNVTSYAWSVETLDPGATPWSIISGNTATVTYDAGSGAATFKLIVTNEYKGVECVDSCTITIECAQDRFCTYTQGAYGNAGGTHCDGTTTPTFLTGLLANPLVLGGNGNTLTFTAADVANSCFFTRVPGGGPSAQLLGNATCANPVGIVLNGTKFKNTLLQQTITMGLNLRISGSGLADLHLNGVYFTTYQSDATGCGDIDGQAVPGTEQVHQLPASVITYLGANNTVADLYNLANLALAGTYTGTSPSLSEIAGAIDMLNNAFDECRALGGFYNSPPPNFRGEILTYSDESTSFNVKAYPNPFSQKAMIEFMVNGAGSDVTVDVYTLTGSKVATLFSGYAEAGYKYNVELDGANLPEGIYIYRVSSGDATYNDKLILIK